MRDYGKVHSTFWTSETVRGMSEDGRALAFYLLTTPHGNIAGIFRLPNGYACEDLQWTSERVESAFNETLSKGFANRCETTKWVWICKHFEWNSPENPNQRKAVHKIANSIPAECSWRDDFHRENAEILEIKNNPSETLPKPLPNRSLTSSSNSNSNKNKGREKISLPDFVPKENFDAFVEMRIKRKKPLTDRAMTLLIGKLTKAHGMGIDVGALLDKSTLNCWQDIYLPEEKPAEKEWY